MDINDLITKGKKYKEEGHLKKANKNFEKAVKICTDILARDPGHESCRFDLGRVYYELGKLKEAREAFNRLKEHTMVYGLDVKARDWLEKIDLDEGITIKEPGIDPDVEQIMKLLYLDPRVTSLDSALSYAADIGDSKAVEVLLKKGANPKYNPPSGWTPLLNAAKNGHGDIVKILLKEGADPNDQNVFAAHTPLILAAMDKHEEVVRILIEAGADVNRKNNFGGTALNKGRSSAEIEKMLLEAGAKE
jgi:ankyrin repeat protein